MDEKTRIALAVLDDHEQRYGVAAPPRLRTFYDGEFAAYHLRWATGKVPGFGGGDTFQLAVTPPTWLGKDDDAVNGPDGEWPAARWFLPVFVTDQSLYLVVDLRTPDARVGWYEEASFESDGDGYRDGVFGTGQGLADFLTGLRTAVDDPDSAYRPADPDQADEWDEAAEHVL